MKFLAATLCLLSISCSVYGSTPLKNQEATEEVVESLQLEKAEVSKTSEKTIIKVSDTVSYALENRPDLEVMKKVLGAQESNPLEAYESLSPEDQKKFQEVRISFLTGAARVLSASKFILGAGSLVGNAFSFVKAKIRHPLTTLEAKEKVGFKERSQKVVESILKGIDSKLWYQAPLVIDSNEIGIVLTAGIVAETGILKKGAGGAEEIGFSLAVNKKEKSFVFELFHNSEVFDNTKAAVTVVGIVGKGEVFMAHRSGAETIKGTSFYPPAVPGHSATAAEYFSAGASTSLGFPPPPLADLLTFTNRFERHTWLRIVVSPVMKGFVRLEVGDIPGSLKIVKTKFENAYSAVAQKIRFGRKNSCELAFAI